MGTYGQPGTVITGSPPACRVYNNAAIPITQSVNTALTFNSERVDTDAMHSTVTNTGRITFNTAGEYIVGVNVEWAFNATSFRLLGIRLNGSTIIGQVLGPPESTGVGTQQSVVTKYKFAINDYIEVVVQQNTTGSLNITSIGNYVPEFWAEWVGLGT